MLILNNFSLTGIGQIAYNTHPFSASQCSRAPHRVAVASTLWMDHMALFYRCDWSIDDIL